MSEKFNINEGTLEACPTCLKENPIWKADVKALAQSFKLKIIETLCERHDDTYNEQIIIPKQHDNGI